MRKLCPNYDNENALDTVLEVPIPEEMFVSMGNTAQLRWNNLRALMKAQALTDKIHLASTSNSEFVALIKIVGAPLVPFQVLSGAGYSFRSLKDCSIEASTAKYIVQQYVAATGGQAALNAVNSMYAIGEVKMVGSEMQQHEDGTMHTQGNCEIGGFVLWQKNPDLWCLELVVSGFKVTAGSNGKVAWNQAPAQPCYASKGPPRPLRRLFQGLDPRSTANLFIGSVCIGEKKINQEECFVLKIEAPVATLHAQSSPNTELLHHTIWGYFSQRTGLLVHLEDTKLVRMKSSTTKTTNSKNDNSIFWETTMESSIEDYRYVEGINIAHSGKTNVTLFRYGAAQHHKRKIEERWRIEEVDFNICGLSMDCFLPPSELNRDQENAETVIVGSPKFAVSLGKE